MGVIQSLFNITFDVARSAIGANMQNATTTIYAAQPGIFRPITDTSKLYKANNVGKEYELFCNPDLVIKPNDRITIDGVLYGVMGVSLFEDPIDGSEDHLEIRISKVVNG